MSTAVAASVMLPPEVSERNDLHDFGPAFLISETAFTTTAVPVVFAKDYHRGNRFSFSFVRK
jgi:GntR family transcriptional regulator